jgi:hypothetical protein
VIRRGEGLLEDRGAKRTSEGEGIGVPPAKLP